MTGEDRLKRFLSCKHRNVQQFTECCLECGENIYSSVQEILQKERQEAERKKPWDGYGDF